jgi:predicted phage tail protein
MRNVYLYGILAEKFGTDPIKMDASNIYHIISMLNANFGQEFNQILREGRFMFIRGNKDVPEPNMIQETEVLLDFNPTEDVHIIPVVDGGIVWVVVALVIYAIVQAATSHTPKMDNYMHASIDNRPSFVFNGPVNVQEQGGPMPLVYGRFRTGSVVGSAGLAVEQL